MKKPEIIEIQNISDAQPRKKTWYKYFDDIFISVICSDGRKSHIRNKNINEYTFTDNKMCFWHCNWQYDLIESFYGDREKGVKTYEKIIFYNDEKHIVDSVVGNIGIEFQHTLSVDIDEMNSRWEAQKHNGYNPYLILDFTNYSIPDFLSKEYSYNQNSFKKLLENCEDSEIKKILKKIIRWSKSMHFLNDNLFIDFNNGVVRFSNKLLNGNLEYSKKEIVESLFLLDSILLKKINLDNIESENRARKLRKIEKIQLAENLKEQQEKLRLISEEEEEVKQKEKKKLLQNIYDKKNSADFANFRAVLKENKINKYFTNIDFESALVEFNCYTEKHDKLIIKHYLYYSKKLAVLIIYSNNGTIENEKYNFLFNEIKILRKTDGIIRSFNYKKNKGEMLKLLLYKSEVALGYLHSLNDFALVKFNDNQKPILRQHFIFNKPIDPTKFNDISVAISAGIEYLIQVEEKNEEIINELNNTMRDIYASDDDFKFIRDISSNYGINSYYLAEYYKHNRIEFSDYLLERFFVIDY